MITCKICNKEYKRVCDFSRYHLKVHDLSQQEYYDKYLKPSDTNEGFCKYCNKPTKFLTISKGYLDYCNSICAANDPTFISRRQNTCLIKYGVKNGINKTRLEQMKQNNLDKYGVEYSWQREDVKNKCKQTHIKNLGCENPSQSDEIKKKKEITHINHYGTKNNFGIPSISRKAVEKVKTKEVKEKARQTCLQKYGVEYYTQTQIFKDYISENKHSILDKINNTKRKNKTFNTSKIEDDFYDKLCTIYGIDNVKRNYKSTLYPFLCDFYIEFLDLYIELHIHWTHRKHFYDSTNSEDQKTLELWKTKAKTSKYFKNAIHTWTVRDIEKRNIALNNNLNYLVLWNTTDINNFLTR